jgi:hypothetical protein
MAIIYFLYTASPEGVSEQPVRRGIFDIEQRLALSAAPGSSQSHDQTGRLLLSGIVQKVGKTLCEGSAIKSIATSACFWRITFRHRTNCAVTLKAG